MTQHQPFGQIQDGKHGKGKAREKGRTLRIVHNGIGLLVFIEVTGHPHEALEIVQMNILFGPEVVGVGAVVDGEWIATVGATPTR